MIRDGGLDHLKPLRFIRISTDSVGLLTNRSAMSMLRISGCLTEGHFHNTLFMICVFSLGFYHCGHMGIVSIVGLFDAVDFSF